jgi:alkaline phosphatase
MKRFKLILISAYLVVALAVQGQESPRVKYAFLFIGDGMGISQISLTQAYLASLEKEIGMTSLTFTGFPVTGLMQTHSNNKLITCSASAGTAMATGFKTDNGRISVSPDKSEIYTTIAEKAKQQGMRIGLVTSVSIDHATPAVFYAHQPSRNMYFEIGYQLATSNFDYFAGGGFKEPVKQLNGKEVNLLTLAEDNGFIIMNDVQEFKALNKTREKVLMLSPKTASGASLPYAIDAGPGDVSLLDYTAKGIELLEGPEGFFMMVEGGKIDWAGHANDAATTVHEMLAFDEAIAMAVDFYKNHPEETIIVVTSDHETGGLSLGNRVMQYETNPAILQHQKASVEKFTLLVRTIREKKSGDIKRDFKKFLKLLEANLGLNSKTNNTLLDEAELEMLKEVMAESIYKDANDTGGYPDYKPLAAAALELVSQKAGIAWGSGAHTYVDVPVFAIGAGAEAFSGMYDNTELPKKLEILMGID